MHDAGHIPGTWRHTLAFILTFTLLLGLGWQGMRVQQALLDANAEVNHSLELITVIQDLQLTLQDVETGERGYVITGQAAYLQPYHQALERVSAERESLQQLLEQRSVVDQAALAELDALIARRLEISEANIAVRDSDGMEAAALRLLAAGGRQTMDRLRGSLEQLEDDERRRLGADTQRAADQAERARWLGLGGALLAGGLLLAAFLSVNRNLRLRRRLALEALHREARMEALLEAVPDELYRIVPGQGVSRLLHSQQPPSPVDAAFAEELAGRLGDEQDLQHSFMWHADSGDEFEVRMLPTRDGEYLAVCRDVTDRLRSRRRLRDQQTFLRSIVDADENLIFARDVSGRFRMCNQAFAAFLGVTPNELEGRSAAELHHGQRLLPMMAGDSELLAGKPEQRAMALEVQDADGRTRWLQLLKRPLTLSDGSRYLLAVAVDITERRAMERMKAEFIATVSHELRTPLTAIRGAVSMLNSGMAGRLPEDAAPLLEIADHNSERLVHLINDILDIEKLESGRLSFQWETLPLATLVEAALRDNTPVATSFEITLVAEGQPVEGLVEVDRHRFAQVMANLISNACKHSPSGERVIVTQAADGAEWLEVAVTDHGAGIPLAFQPRVFERFAQADASDRRRTGGTGLGLAITRALVEEMGGEIDFTSTPGEGTCFRIRLPRRDLSSVTQGKGTL
ncbi:PAS domain S-box-containing protein [Franzmannia pantelleriensis]|uniref:histidine kinase n=1 Tax=Franzmannia pantelleriensis TaxID=48727 RepID=A0A1G9M5T0_9GAMM|nr:CHASE3 domain-containing protein [Halomonas pantelleriensis]SDL69609.1 PAS domain S-box-containing protein [Halomonas pantelleriensis]